MVGDRAGCFGLIVEHPPAFGGPRTAGRTIYVSMWIESRTVGNPATSAGRGPADRPAAIISRVPSTSTIQNSFRSPGPE
jgi:hypothetical protein